MTSQKGFTLIEIIIVVAIFIVIASFGMTVDWQAFRTDTFHAEESTIIAILQKARSRAMGNFFESAHGVCYIEPNYVIFRTKEGSCEDGETTNELFSANIEIASNLSTTFPVIIFDQLSGNTTGDTIHITDGVKSADVAINNEGTINW